MKKKKSKPKTWLVEMCNTTDSRDDEVWKVRAIGPGTAKSVADMSSRGSFLVGRIVPARGGTSTERELAQRFRTYCTKELP